MSQSPNPNGVVFKVEVMGQMAVRLVIEDGYFDRLQRQFPPERNEPKIVSFLVPLHYFFFLLLLLFCSVMVLLRHNHSKPIFSLVLEFAELFTFCSVLVFSLVSVLVQSVLAQQLLFLFLLLDLYRKKNKQHYIAHLIHLFTNKFMT